MDLFSLQYILFICILLLLYYLLPELARSFSISRRNKGADRQNSQNSQKRQEEGTHTTDTESSPCQWMILLAASLCLYAYLSKWALLLLLLTSFSVWSGGLLLARQEERYQVYRKDKTHSREERKTYKKATTRNKRRILVLDLILNFGILAFLKYFAVLIPTFSAWISLGETAGGSTGISGSGLLLPLGISFYTFQAVSYLIDQYNGKYPAEKNPFKFLLFVSWFPQLLQGPIGRFDKLGSQLTERHHFNLERSRRALLLILYGLMKKYAIADMLVTSISDILDGGDIADLPGSLIVFAILLYSAQQYTDFSGGIDIIRGISELFGIELAINFRQPYFSASLGDFWRRWHISLGAWMRDYLFYPFALLKPMQKFGKWCTKHFGRQGKHLGRVLPAGIANIVVFLVVGLWHGPEMHYLLWGLYNGIVIALSDLTEPFWKGLNKKLHIRADSKGFHVFRIIRTFLIVNIGWYFDRIYQFRDVCAAFRRTFTAFEPGRLAEGIRTQVIAKSTAFNIAGGWSLAILGLLLVFIVSLTDELHPAGKGDQQTQSIITGSMAGESAAMIRFEKKRFLPKALLIILMILMVFGSFLFTETAGGFLYANF